MCVKTCFASKMWLDLRVRNTNIRYFGKQL